MSSEEQAQEYEEGQYEEGQYEEGQYEEGEYEEGAYEEGQYEEGQYEEGEGEAEESEEERKQRELEEFEHRERAAIKIQCATRQRFARQRVEQRRAEQAEALKKRLEEDREKLNDEEGSGAFLTEAPAAVAPKKPVAPGGKKAPPGRKSIAKGKKAPGKAPAKAPVKRTGSKVTSPADNDGNKTIPSKPTSLDKAESKKSDGEWLEPIEIPDGKTVDGVFRDLDVNGNGMLSLAELDKGIITFWPKFNIKAAIMRAYQAADKNDTGFVSRKEFGYFIEYIVVFQNSWTKFAKLDTTGDRRLSEAEFVDGAAAAGLVENKSADDLRKMFASIDANGGGVVLFDEFCAAFANEEVLARRLEDAKREEAAAKEEQRAAEEQAQRKAAEEEARRAKEQEEAEEAAAAARAAEKASSNKKGSGMAPRPPVKPKPNDSGRSAPASESHSVEPSKPKGDRKKFLPVIETTLAQPRQVRPKVVDTPDSEDLKLPPILPQAPKHKIRIEGDPTIDALEEKIRQRRKEERQRQEALKKRIDTAQEAFQRQQEEREKQEHEARMEELRLRREEQQRKAEMRQLQEQQRQLRLRGRVKVDMDVIEGKKSILELHKERAMAMEEEEQKEREAKLKARHQEYRMGRDFYNELAEHEQREKERWEKEAEDRQSRKSEVSLVPKLPDEFETRARKRVLGKDKKERQERLAARATALDNFRERYRYAADVKEHHKPKKFKEFSVLEEKHTAPREALDMHKRNIAGNENLTLSIGKTSGNSTPRGIKSPKESPRHAKEPAPESPKIPSPPQEPAEQKKKAPKKKEADKADKAAAAAKEKEPKVKRKAEPAPKQERRRSSVKDDAPAPNQERRRSSVKPEVPKQERRRSSVKAEAAAPEEEPAAQTSARSSRKNSEAASPVAVEA